jgi:trimethylamine-N-oxide reductase (cytochrome c) cytochrome c-type subunit TorY
MKPKKKKDQKRFSFKKLYKTKTGIFLVLLPLFIALTVSSHEISVRYFQDKTCVVCHEMKEPIRKWIESGTNVNHNNCAGCHYTADFNGWMEMNKSAIKQLVEHFKRDPNEPLKPREEPLFLELDKEPGYWSHVPNSRCYQCKDAKNHKQIEQQMVHRKLINDISKQPCKDCHNHEMRKGQKFYEKVLQEEEKAGTA